MLRCLKSVAIATAALLCLDLCQPLAAAPLFPVVAQTTQDHKAAGDRFLQKGKQRVANGQYKAALEELRQALAIYRQVNDRVGAANTLWLMGTIYWDLNDYQQTEHHFQQALPIFQALGDRSGEAYTLTGLGQLYGMRWSMAHNPLYDVQRAIAYHQQALTIFQQEQLTVGEAYALMGLGVVSIHVDEQQANQFLQQALSIFQRTGDRRGEGRTQMHLGIVYGLLEGNWQKAIQCHQQNLSLLRQTGDRTSEAFSLLYLSKNIHMSDTQAEKHYLQQALEIFQQIGNLHGEAITLDHLASTQLILSDFQQAISDYEKSLVLFQRVGDLRGEAGSLQALGVVYRLLGNYRAEIGYSRRALLLFQQIGDRAGVAYTLLNSGNAYSAMGQHDLALQYHQQALAMPNNLFAKANALNALGRDYLALKDYKQAIRHHEQALSLFQELEYLPGQARALSNLGVDYLTIRNNSQAISFLQKALLLTKQNNYRQLEQAVLGHMGRIFIEQRQPELAIAFLKQSVKISESIRQDIRGLSHELQESYVETVADTYRSLADLLLQQDRILEAQQILDLLKVQELKDYLWNVRGTEQRLEFLRPETEILNKYNALQQSAIQLGQELGQLRQIQESQRSPSQQQRITQLVQLEINLNQQFNRFVDSPDVVQLTAQLSHTARRQNVNLEDLNALRNNLRQHNAALLYPLILEDRLELILTTPDAPPMRRTVKIQRAELNRMISEFRAAIQDRSVNARKPAQQLYQYVIQPIAVDLQQAKVQTIVYAPDGALRYIPLTALHDGSQWLVQQYRVNHITARSLTDFSPGTAKPPRVLAGAFASGKYNVQVGQRHFVFGGLQFAGKEVEQLVATLPGTKLIDRAFNRDATLPKMNEYSIVHLATHAAFLPGQPEDSFILFGDGRVATLRDIENWSLPNVDLVVLSACETGIGGQLGNGEEILGLGYQFQRAGARSAIASLWSVDDGGTQVLMSAFYAGLKQGMTKVQALQEAQKALITGDYTTVGGDRGGLAAVNTRNGQSRPTGNNPLRHPYYWAPFILIGNGL